jgi:hypothetical protein
MKKLAVGDKVKLNVEKFEMSPLNFVYEGQGGVIIDETYPDYYKVKFTNYQLGWIDCKYLDKIND